MSLRSDLTNPSPLANPIDITKANIGIRNAFKDLRSPNTNITSTTNKLNDKNIARIGPRLPVNIKAVS